MSMEYDLHGAIGYQLTLTARLLERRFEQALHGLGLTRTSWCVALAVGGAGLHHPSDIAAYIGIDRTATSRALRRMEHDGLIRRAPGQDDGRTRQVSLTQAGHERLKAANQAARKARGEAEARLEPGELETLRTLLAKLRSGDQEPLAKI